MSEEKKDAAKKEQAAAEPAKKKGKKRLPVILGVIAVIAVIAGIGFYQWHESPTFCNAFCHNMDEFVETYYEAPNTTGTDKWGNEVTNTSSMMVVVHAQAGENCLSCHEPSLPQQMHEGMMYVTNTYEDPIPERSLEELLRNAGNQNEADTFCLNDKCHNMVTRDVLTEATSEMDFNPHRWQHPEMNIQCSDCHKSHRASVFYCTQCHKNAADSLPDGWLTYEEGFALQQAAF